ncbi:hypothetical protein CL614_03455 [archaeon]|nr:hypothetical protein [archaeon]|tara:strand:- start:1844 stop:2215 length:372 start_codon:yes stop_codon:yes gene_type:complete
MKNIEKMDEWFEKLQKTETQVGDFSDLLSDLGNITDKKKLLWKEIYQNAVIDRQNAGILFTEAYKSMQPGVTEHVTLGAILSKYLERMCKSNEQILRLAELIAKNEERSAHIDTEDVFSKIEN